MSYFCTLLATPVTKQDRYLHFDNIDMAAPELQAHCSCCRKEFRATPNPYELVDEVASRLRSEFDAHECKSYDATWK